MKSDLMDVRLRPEAVRGKPWLFLQNKDENSQ